MKNKLARVLKNIIGLTLFYSAFFLLGYLTYYIFFPERNISFFNFAGFYLILLQITVLVLVATNKDDK
jgi:hypothetical protein